MYLQTNAGKVVQDLEKEMSYLKEGAKPSTAESISDYEIELNALRAYIVKLECNVNDLYGRFCTIKRYCSTAGISINNIPFITGSLDDNTYKVTGESFVYNDKLVQQEGVLEN
jgi:hypothetical protein